MIDLPTEAEPVKVVCGDSLEVLRDLASGCFDAVLTDPPYGIKCQKVGAGTGGKGTFHRFTTPGSATIAGDGAVDGRWIRDAYRVLRSPGYLFSFSRWDVDAQWQAAILAAGFRIKNRAIWAKAHFGSGDLEGAYGFQHESIWVACKGRGRLRGKRTGDVWRDQWTECIRHGKTHPFEKPLDLMRKVVAESTDPGDLILDPFGGSGTTAVAAIHEGRRCLIVEKDPTYCDIIRRRVAESLSEGLFTGVKSEQPSLFAEAS